MATAQGQTHEMSFMEMIERLVNMAKPVTNDERQTNYCKYINTFLSHYGSERCMIVGSTQEGTRLRIRQDEGDYDFLVISEIVIPIEYLEYIHDIPCFVHIDGRELRDKFLNLELVDGKYIPSSLLRECRPEAFKQIRNIFQIVSNPDIFQCRQRVNLQLDREIKAGTSVETYEVECTDQDVFTDKTEKDPMQIVKQFKNNISQEPMTETRHAFGKILDVLQDLKEKTDNKKVPRLYQLYGPIIEALVGNIGDKPSDQVVHQKSTVVEGQVPLDISNLLSNDHKTGLKSNDRTCNKPPANEAPVVVVTDNEMPETLTSNNTNDTEEPDSKKLDEPFEKLQKSPQVAPGILESHSAGETDVHQNIMLKYFRKSHIDLIPAFPLAGKPKYLDEWRNRERYWPLRQTVDDIYHSQFFVVAKPATIGPNKLIDFCLGYNIAEIKIAKAMSSLQRKVILMLKAFQKSVLSEYSDDLTTFHWKTVVYWVSETWSHSLFVDTEHTILMLLKNVLEHMTDCLCQQDLQHYFIPANLFAGMDPETAFQIVSKIVDIQEEPVDAMRQFFFEQVNTQQKFEVISGKRVKELKGNYLDPSEQAKTKQIASAINAFEKQDGSLNEVIIDVILNCLPSLKEEMERGENSEDINASRVSLDDVFNNFFTYIMTPGNEERAMKEAKERFITDLLSMDPRNRKN